METIINLIIQLVAGVAGGNAAGAALKNYDLGTLGNTIAGAIGGLGGAGEEYDGRPAGPVSSRGSPIDARDDLRSRTRNSEDEERP
jgi:hypothetical protein